ncbi:MAG: hypothetical protein N7Q72_02445, partial [Spiroplasma sp. Tabriz.8]|nr:hypothetical protein [Spiroplasma sp. Tabriz.8]
GYISNQSSNDYYATNKERFTLFRFHPNVYLYNFIFIYLFTLYIYIYIYMLIYFIILIFMFFKFVIASICCVNECLA